jgi:tetratricopeptide (TPR) repeat protein
LDQGQQSLVCESQQTLGVVYNCKGETEKAIYHFEKGLKIASAFNCHNLLFEIHFDLVKVFCRQGRFNDANAHIGQLKLDAGNNLFDSGNAMEVQARIWYGQRRLEDAKSEALCVLEILQGVGAAVGVKCCRYLLQIIDGKIESHSTNVHNQW